ncbi:MAG: hypothetical protein MUC97_14210 [Bernardetiaceae bacterium]|nr:hypothetical protein [Bernardetiaceae bacterium]
MATNPDPSQKPAWVSWETWQQYQAGELDDQAMHALERALVEHPLLAEADEGLQLAGTEAALDLAELRQRLRTRVQAAPPVRLARRAPIYRAAAAVALLVACLAGLGWWLNRYQTGAEALAVEESSQAVPPDTASLQQLADQRQAIDAVPGPVEALEKLPPSERQSKIEAEQVKPAPAPIALDQEEVNKELASDELEKPAVVNQLPKPAPEVTSANEAPVPVKAETVENQIAPPNLARQEKKATNPGALGGQAADSTALTSLAPVPVGGWAAYNAYLAEVREEPDQAKKKGEKTNRARRRETANAQPPAQVVLRLTIAADGAIKQVPVMPRPNAGCAKARLGYPPALKAGLKRQWWR